MSLVGRLDACWVPRIDAQSQGRHRHFRYRSGVREIKAGKIEYRVEKAGILHTGIGKASFTEEQLLANLMALLEAVMRAKPASAKGQYLRSSRCRPHGPAVRVDPAKVEATLKAEAATA